MVVEILRDGYGFYFNIVQVSCWLWVALQSEELVATYLFIKGGATVSQFLFSNRKILLM